MQSQFAAAGIDDFGVEASVNRHRFAQCRAACRDGSARRLVLEAGIQHHIGPGIGVVEHFDVIDIKAADRTVAGIGEAEADATDTSVGDRVVVRGEHRVAVDPE